MPILKIVVFQITVGLIFTLPLQAQSTDTVQDPDGQIYSTAILKDSKRWLLENLNYDLEGAGCNDDKPSNCDKYGRLYTWDASKIACHALGEGWRLPTGDDWRNLVEAYGGKENSFDRLIAGGDSGFDILFAGRRFWNDFYWSKQRYAYFWVDELFSDQLIQNIHFYKLEKRLEIRPHDKRNGFSCRCVKD